MSDFKSNEIYALEMYHRNTNSNVAYCDLLVLDSHNTIHLANIIGQDSKVKQVAWLMQEGKVGQIRRAEGPHYEQGHQKHSVYSIADRKACYDEYSGKSDDLTHTLLISKNAKLDLKVRKEWFKDEEKRIADGNAPRKMPSELAELILAWDGDYKAQIFEVLNDRYNTPMLEEWADYIINALEENGGYEALSVKCYGSDYDLKAGLLRVTEQELESIITDGIQSYELEFAVEEDDTVEPILDKCQTTDDYLTHFAAELGQRIQENVKVCFDPAEQKHHPAFYDVNLQANEQGITGLYPPQANTIMGIVNTLSTEAFCFLIGEMGTGKTVQGAIIPYITEASIQNVEHNPKPQRVIVLSPSIMVEKWAREIKERIPNCKTHIINHWTDVKKIEDANVFIDSKGKRKFKKPEQWEYYIISSELSKFTFPLEPIKDWRTKKDDMTLYHVDEVDPEQTKFISRTVFHEDGTTERVKERVVKPEYKVRFEKTYIQNPESGDTRQVLTCGDTGFYCPKCGGILKGRGDKVAGENFFGRFNKTSEKFVKNMTKENLVCRNDVDTSTLPKSEVNEWVLDTLTQRYVPAEPTQECGYVLWQPEQLPVDSGYRKVSPIWYINKRLPRGFFKYLVADEVHEYKSGDSAIGQAFGQLINHTEKQILLTGTLMGGMSRDVFYLLARLNPKQLLKESITYYDETVFNKRYGISEFNTRSIEGRLKKNTLQKPGISPHLFPIHLMANCAFLELNDMGYALPPYEEIPVVVDMSEEHALAYNSLAKDMLTAIRSEDDLKGMASVSTFMNAMYQYADAPFNVPEISTYNSEGKQFVLGEPRNFDKNEFMPAKLQELINTVDEEVYVHGRKNLVYVKYTGTEAWNQMDTYLYDEFKKRGFKVGILRNGRSYDGIKMPKNSRSREAWLHDMMEKHDWDVLITNPRLVKVGLDLLSFPSIHFFQLDYSTYDYMQASRRSWRLKQTKNVKVFTYVYRGTIQEKALNLIARKIDAALAMQGKFSEEGLRAMADSGDGMNALAKQLMQDDVLEELDTVHDIFARKNQSFEEMQSVEFQDYDGYVMNPIEGGMDTVRKIAQGLITHVEEEEKAGRATSEDVRRTKETVSDYLDMFDNVLKQVDNIREYNKGVSKNKQVIEGQQALDLFAL